MAKLRKPIWKDYILCYSNYMTFWKRQNMETVKWSVVVRGWSVGKEWIGTTVFLGLSNYSLWYHNDGYMSYSFKTYSMYNTKSEL